MKRIFSPLGSLLASQFLSAFVDNMLLFIAQAIILRDAYPDYYLPLVQGLYLAAYILASPWVGGFSDFIPKARVLLVGNMIKAFCLVGFVFGINPAISYGIYGLGSVLYSPAKYGILPFLAKDEQQLMKANSWMEGTTIVAILGGAVVGGFLSDYSIPLACGLGLFLYVFSIGFTYRIPLNPGTGCMPGRFAIRDFIADIGFFMKHVDARFSVIGSAFFWTVSNILRLGMFAWVPEELGLAGNKPVSLLMAVIGIGIGIGALLAPKFVSVRTYRKAILFGIIMGIIVMVLSYVHTLNVAIVLIFLVGIMGGLYIVPVNTLNEYLGDRTIGTGRATTVQNFAENTFMLLGTAAYSMAERIDIPIDHTIRWSGVLLLAFMAFLAFYRKGSPVAVRGDAE
ncbi:MAG TPA: lysophospholipid transporter LplT [Negativicutes bacterium]|nr:lysophospholipid transporter LplT [Negativicutes bacterium]